MAVSVEVGALVVRLIADAKQLETALSKGSADFRKLGNEAERVSQQASKAGDAMAKAFTGVAGRLAGLAAAYLSANNALKLFQNALSDASALNRLSQQTGVAVEQLDALRFAAQQTGVEFSTVEQAMSGWAQRLDNASVALRALGVSARDSHGGLRNFADMLPDLAERFASYRDGVAKAQLATALFGEEAGPRLLPLLNQGRAGIEQLMQRARELGLVMGRDEVENLRRVQTGWEQFNTQLSRTIANSPVVQDALRLVNQLLEKNNQVLANNALARAAQQAERAWAAYAAQQEKIMELEAQRDALDLRYHSAEHQRLNELLIKEDAHLAKLREELVLHQQRANAFGIPSPTDTRPSAPSIGGASEANERAQFELDQLMERLTGTRDLLDEMNFAWMTHADGVAMAVEKINQAHEAGFRRDQAITKATQQLRRVEQQAMLDTASMAAQTIVALWPKQKGAAIAAAIINTSVGITKALSTLPPPYSWVQAGLIAAQGAAQIATIRSTSETGSSGGAGGGSQVAPAEPTADFGRSLTIQGVDPAHIFSGSQVRGLIESINEEVRNGATLISSGRLAA